MTRRMISSQDTLSLSLGVVKVPDRRRCETGRLGGCERLLRCLAAQIATIRPAPSGFRLARHRVGKTGVASARLKVGGRGFVLGPGFLGRLAHRSYALDPLREGRCARSPRPLVSRRSRSGRSRSQSPRRPRAGAEEDEEPFPTSWIRRLASEASRRPRLAIPAHSQRKGTRWPSVTWARSLMRSFAARKVRWFALRRPSLSAMSKSPLGVAVEGSRFSASPMRATSSTSMKRSFASSTRARPRLVTGVTNARR